MRLVAVCVLALASNAAAKPCASRGLKPVAVTTHPTAIPSDGGFLVMAAPASYGSDDVAADDVDAAIQRGWKLDGKLPTIDKLAPGLAVYRADGPGPARLVDDHGALVAEGTVGKTKGTRPSTPVVTSVVASSSRTRRGAATVVTVEIDGPLPPGVAALVIAKPDGTPLAWGLASSSVVVYANGGCTTPPLGATPPAPGAKVTAMWVDETGHLSPPSKPLVVSAR